MDLGFGLSGGGGGVSGFRGASGFRPRVLGIGRVGERGGGLGFRVIGFIGFIGFRSGSKE